MGAVAKMRLAGFDVALEGDVLKIRPSTGLSDEQRAFIKAHKVVLLEELRADVLAPALAPATEPHSSICAEVASPLEARIAELVADGWAIWNATVKAESEAMLADVGHSNANTINQPTLHRGLVELSADVIAAHPAQPAQIPIAGARYSQWRVMFHDGNSATLREPKPTTFDQVVIYCRSLTSFASVEPLGEPMA